ncbi:MAG: hypothetical protein IKG22_05580 [Atopobiaceae bacterium]|nr:hypothetical protein [Atopobiaceae bacterium]
MDFLYDNLGTIVSIVIAVGATYAAISSRLTKLETLIAELRRDVEKHNGVIERTYGLEADMKAMQVEVSTIKQSIDKGAA